MSVVGTYYNQQLSINTSEFMIVNFRCYKCKIAIFLSCYSITKYKSKIIIDIRTFQQLKYLHFENIEVNR